MSSIVRSSVLLALVASSCASPPPTCITRSQVDASQAAWASALENIGKAWTGSEDGKNAQDCTAAKQAAEGALDAAYAYGSQPNKVLFKPTLTSGAHTFRNDRAGALSYFVGSCAGSNHIEQDGGFALGYSAGTAGDPSTYQGFTNVQFHDMSYHLAESEGSPFCESALAQGKMTITSRLTGAKTTVDKTFAYVKNPDANGAPLLLTVHHSSLAILETKSKDDNTADQNAERALMMSIVALSVTGALLIGAVVIAIFATCSKRRNAAESPSAAVEAKGADKV